MTNKREFFFIIFLCALSVVIFYSSKREILIAANSLNAVPGNTSLSSSDDKEELLEESAEPAEADKENLSEDDDEWSGVPSAEIQTEEAETANSAKTDNAELERKADSDKSETLAGEDSKEIKNQGEPQNSSKNNADNLGADSKSEQNSDISAETGQTAASSAENLVSPEKKYSDYDSESKDAAGNNKKAEIASAFSYQVRNKEASRNIVKIQEEKGTIFDLNKSKNGSEESLKIENRIAPLETEEDAKKIELIVKETELDNNQESKELDIEDIKKVSAASKSEILGVNAAFKEKEMGKKDSDEDGIDDELELKIGTDPKSKDSDKDGFNDGVELNLGYNPAGKGMLSGRDLALAHIPLIKGKDGKTVIADSDGDGISDREEAIIGTDAFNSDSDADGYGDGEEFSKGYNPIQPASLGDDKVILENPKESSAPIAEKLEISGVERNLNGEEEKIVLKGKADPGSFVAVYVFSSPIAGITKANAEGDWIYVLDKALEAGGHSIYSAFVDASGAIVAKSSPAEFFIEEIEAAPAALPENIIDNLPSNQISIWNIKTYLAISIGAIMLAIIGFMIFSEIRSQ